MSSIFVQKLNKVMERTRIIVRIVLFSSPMGMSPFPQLTSSVRHQPCDTRPHSRGSCPPHPRLFQPSQRICRLGLQMGHHLFILNHSTSIYSVSSALQPLLEALGYMRERKSWVPSSQCFQRSLGAELSRQQYHRVGQLAGKAEEGQGAAGITWSLQLFQDPQPSCFSSQGSPGGSGNIYTELRIMCGT